MITISHKIINLTYHNNKKTYKRKRGGEDHDQGGGEGEDGGVRVAVPAVGGGTRWRLLWSSAIQSKPRERDSRERERDRSEGVRESSEVGFSDFC